MITQSDARLLTVTIWQKSNNLRYCWSTGIIVLDLFLYREKFDLSINFCLYRGYNSRLQVGKTWKAKRRTRPVWNEISILRPRSFLFYSKKQPPIQSVLDMGATLVFHGMGGCISI